MNKINHIESKSFIKYARKNLAMITLTMELHLKNIIKSEIIPITQVNTKGLLIIFVI